MSYILSPDQILVVAIIEVRKWEKVKVSLEKK